MKQLFICIIMMLLVSNASMAQGIYWEAIESDAPVYKVLPIDTMSLQSFPLNGPVKRFQMQCFSTSDGINKLQPTQGLEMESDEPNVDFQHVPATAEFDAQGRMTSLKYSDMEYRFDYDTQGRLAKEFYINRQSEDPNNYYSTTKTYQYEGGRCVKVLEKDNNDAQNSLFFDYDGRGNIIKMTTRSAGGDVTVNTAAFVYDSQGRLVEKSFSGSHSVKYEYDNKGRVVKETINYLYEPNIKPLVTQKFYEGNATKPAKEISSCSDTFNEYDKKGRMVHSLIKNYDCDTHESLGDAEFFFTYDAKPGSKEYKQAQMAYDSNNQLIKSASMDTEMQITYDSHGNWTHMVEYKNGAPITISERQIEYW